MLSIGTPTDHQRLTGPISLCVSCFRIHREPSSSGDVSSPFCITEGQRELINIIRTGRIAKDPPVDVKWNYERIDFGAERS